jgi:RHS repeat-associated protein
MACAEEPTEGPPPLPEGTIHELGEADVLLFADALGSLAEETSGSGHPKATFASYPFGLGRYDSSGESRKYAGGVRDSGVGLDPMGARVFAPDLGVWTSPDPVAVHDPERSVGHDAVAANPYAYANLTPAIATDEKGQWPHVVVGAVVGAVAGAAVEAASQLASRGYIESWGKVVGQAGVGALTGTVTVMAGPQAGLATLAAIGATAGASSVMTNRLVETGGASVGSATEITAGAIMGAASAGLAAGVTKVVAKFAPKVCSCGVCFAAGTPVLTREGEVPIEAVRVGDWVRARDDETGETAWRQVTQTFVTPGREVLVLTLRDATGFEERLHVTPEHPLRPEGTTWTAAGDLQLGSVLATEDGRWVEVTAAVVESRTQTVYNLEVDEFHTYFAGENQVWAHNPCPPAGSGSGGSGSSSADPYRRVKWRKSTVETLKERAPKTPEGDFIDPNTGRVIPKEGPFDVGHKPGHEYRKNRIEAAKNGASRKDFIESENNPDHLQLEDPQSNRSHQFEAPDK